MTGLQISRRFCEQVVLPLLRQRHPELVDRVAIGVAGTGSDVLGLDDAISRDHHWGPRSAILLLDRDADDFGDAIRRTMLGTLPAEFEGHPVRFDPLHRTAVCVDGISSYLAWFLGTGKLPACDEDWFGLCETDLLHVTSGEVFHDPAEEWSAVRRALAYYPERVWRKRVADWCMYVTGRDAPYNLYRVLRRSDPITLHVYFGQAIRRVIELGCAIERRYAPYPKWQYRLFRTIGGCADRVLPLLEEMNATHDWRARVDALISVNRIYAERLHALGLASAPAPRAFDEGLTDLTLYSSARQLYERLPHGWREISFNQIESWEKLARLVLFDEGDYFRTRVEAL